MLIENTRSLPNLDNFTAFPGASHIPRFPVPNPGRDTNIPSQCYIRYWHSFSAVVCLDADPLIRYFFGPHLIWWSLFPAPPPVFVLQEQTTWLMFKTWRAPSHSEAHWLTCTHSHIHAHSPHSCPALLNLNVYRHKNLHTWICNGILLQNSNMLFRKQHGQIAYNKIILM